MKKSKICFVALYGPQGVGKTSIATAMTMDSTVPTDKRWKRRALAQPIRDMLSHIVPDANTTIGKVKESAPKELQGKTIRRALQTLGTEWGRDMIGQDIWLDVMVRWAYESNTKRVVVDDLRMQNEYDFFKKRGGLIIQIERPSIESTSSDQHKSEVDWKTWTPDFKVKNINPAEAAREILDICETHFG